VTVTSTLSTGVDIDTLRLTVGAVAAEAGATSRQRPKIITAAKRRERIELAFGGMSPEWE
jgi:hypothetical protein